MQYFFKKIVRKEELQKIFEVDERKEHITLGEITDVYPDHLIACMNLWTRRIDKIIEMDKYCNKGKSTWISHKVNYWRGFTYSEFAALFNPHITPKQFPFYPVFSQFQKRNLGGIKTEKQRTDFILHLEYNEETYAEVLHQNFQTLLEFFFSFSELNSLLSLKALKAHTHIVAPSGYGKSELMRVLFYRMQKKYPKFTFIAIDPHGSLARDLKNSKLNKKSDNRLVYINPTFKEGYTPTFNVFDLGENLSTKNLTQTCEQIFTALEEILSKEAGKRLSEVMTNALEKAIYFVLQKPNSSILDLMALLSAEENICKEAYEYDTFFNDQWKKQGNRTRESLFNRIGRLLNSPILKSFLSGKSTFNLEKCINSGKIIILDIGDVGELTQELIGKLFVASVKSIIRKRRKNTGLPTFMFIDEVHILMTGSFEYILSQLRGYGLHLVLAHQYISQLSTKNADAIRQNSAVKIGGGDDFEDIGKMIKKMPKNPYLKMYEWFLKVRHKELTKFKAPNILLKKPKKYSLSRKEVKALNKMQLKKYYKVIGEPDRRPERKYPELEEETPTQPLMPPFDLLIKPDGKTTE